MMFSSFHPTVPVLGGRSPAGAARVPREVPVAPALRRGRHREGLRGQGRTNAQVLYMIYIYKVILSIDHLGSEMSS